MRITIHTFCQYEKSGNSQRELFKFTLFIGGFLFIFLDSLLTITPKSIFVLGYSIYLRYIFRTYVSVRVTKHYQELKFYQYYNTNS